LTGKEEEEYVKAAFAHFTSGEAFSLTKIHEGAHEVLADLSKRYRMAIVISREAVSSTNEELEVFGSKKFFVLIGTRESAARYQGMKELPLLPFQEQRKKLYESAIGLMKIDPRNTLCVGDSVSELQPAKELGINTIGVLTGFSSKEDMEKASILTIPGLSHPLKILT
jgi:phosphoglycolate phosphatase-like HAD superfamily hydrolase